MSGTYASTLSQSVALEPLAPIPNLPVEATRRITRFGVHADHGRHHGSYAWNHDNWNGHHHGRHYRNYYGPYLYGGGYGYYDDYGYDDCYWLRRQAIITGSPVWWNRYYACAG